MRVLLYAFIVSCMRLSMTATPFVHGYTYEQGCTFTSNDYATLGSVVGAFENHAEQKIIQRLFASSEYQHVARALTTEFVEDIDMIKVSCEGENGFYADHQSMNDVTQALIEYVGMIKRLKKAEQGAARTTNDLMGTQSLVLQNILYDTFIQDPNGFSAYTMNMMMDIVSQEADMPLSIKFSIDASGVGNNIGTENESSFAVGGTIAGQDEAGVQQSITVDADAEMRIVDDMLYFNIGDVTTGGGVVDAFTQDEFDQLMTAVELVKGKWISMPYTSNSYATMMFGSEDMFSLFDAAKSMTTVPMFTTYSTDGSVVYGGLHPAFCGYVEQVSDCLASWVEGSELSGGKGYVMMQPSKDGYALGITDRFFPAGEKITNEEDGAFMFNTPLLWWNNKEITRFEIPKNDYVDLVYNDNTLHLSANLPQFDYDYESGEIIETAGIDVNLNGTIIDGTYDMVFTMNFPEKFVMNMTLTGSETPIRARSISAPPEDETITLEQLETLIDGAMINAF